MKLGRNVTEFKEFNSIGQGEISSAEQAVYQKSYGLKAACRHKFGQNT